MLGKLLNHSTANFVLIKSHRGLLPDSIYRVPFLNFACIRAYSADGHALISMWSHWLYLQHLIYFCCFPSKNVMFLIFFFIKEQKFFLQL